MQSFVVRPMTWPVLRLFNRSPLIRVSDRIEAAAVTLAVMFVVIATACAGAAGTMIHDVQARKYLEQAHSRHAVVARAVQNSEPTPEAGAFIVNVRWRLNGVEHTDLLGWNKPVTIGAPLDIWVDDNGSRVAPPSPVARAAVDALSTAVVGWFVVVMAIAQVVNAVRAHASRMRDAQWEQDLRGLVDGGRSNRPH
ncbi:membrane protein [Mycobacterium cookii]|uniref:Membrane protein n=1 Tax=Mycobacterium cookii TaxID=1775 RepID=A0A7I7KUS9_9MYCO|nr:hypothetical protein [Mycobacterium cookii]MCV7329941.1 hypothetical protein [Mycobacterium cookii]BBX45870.1 membrane protein [Mycobacterium cookii]